MPISVMVLYCETFSKNDWTSWKWWGGPLLWEVFSEIHFLNKTRNHLSTFLCVKLVHLLWKMQGFHPKKNAVLNPYLKTELKQFFKEVPHEGPRMTRILNSVIVWMVLYCAHKLLGWTKNRNHLSTFCE